MKKRVKLMALILIAAFLAVWLFCLVRCEILTRQYEDLFVPAYRENTMLGEMEYCKVLSCDGESARVYYVSEGYTDANVLSFRKTDGVWIETGWITVWSASGSASDVVWPYWWHFIFGEI